MFIISPPVVIVFVSLGLMDNAESRISADNRIKCVYRFVDPPPFITETEKKACNPALFTSCTMNSRTWIYHGLS